MVLIYLRHSYDNEGPDSTYAHDSKLTKEGKRKAKRKILSLIAKHGVPKVIVTSPFYRARETATIFQKTILEEKQVKVRVVIDPVLGRFFTSEQKKNPEVRRETLKFNPIIQENGDDLMDRIREHIKKVHKKKLPESENFYLFVSHGLVLKKLIREFGQKSPSRVPFLKEFIIKE